MVQTLSCSGRKFGHATTRPLVAAMQQIADWLKKLGMAEYTEGFAENRIDLSVLRHLTDQDLKDIGVLLGDRRKMLAAITQLASSPFALRTRDANSSRCTSRPTPRSPGR
jgi:SAM domain (Sterile alpha motif)